MANWFLIEAPEDLANDVLDILETECGTILKSIIPVNIRDCGIHRLWMVYVERERSKMQLRVCLDGLSDTIHIRPFDIVRYGSSHIPAKD
jgi:hypothetical protein